MIYIQYLTILSLHTITVHVHVHVLPLTIVSIVYSVSEIHCTSNVHVLPQYYTYTITCECNSHITMITVQSSTVVLLSSTVNYHLIKV